jgi:hypothetical protein
MGNLFRQGKLYSWQAWKNEYKWLLPTSFPNKSLRLLRMVVESARIRLITNSSLQARGDKMTIYYGKLNNERFIQKWSKSFLVFLSQNSLSSGANMSCF